VENPEKIEVEEVREPWERVIEQLLSENPESEEALWRVALNIEERFVVVMFDHVLTDGLGLAGFVQDLMSVESAVGRQNDLPPCLEQGVDLNISTSFVLSKLRTPKTLPYYIGPLSNEKSIHSISSTTLASVFVDVTVVDQIAVLCREHKTSVHGVVSTAASLALFQITSGNRTGQLNIQLNTPVSLRARWEANMKQATPAFGNFIAPTEVHFQVVDDTGPWELARFIKDEINSKVIKAEKQLGLLTFVSDLKDFRKKAETSCQFGREATLEVSNLGVCNSSSGWYFAQGNHYYGPLIAVNIVTVAKDGMYITATSKSNLVQPGQLMDFVSTLSRLLTAMASD
jgi:hypothetical protein